MPFLQPVIREDPFLDLFDRRLGEFAGDAKPVIVNGGGAEVVEGDGLVVAAGRDRSVASTGGGRDGRRRYGAGPCK